MTFLIGRLERLTAMLLKIQVFWDVMLCRLVMVTDVSRHCDPSKRL
jgi:hypothetical protein